MIKTNKFKFPKSLYFTILFKTALLRSWWIVVLLFSMTIYQGSKKIDSTSLLLGLLSVIYLLYLVGRCWYHASSKKNALFYKERYFEIDQDSMVSHFDNGTTNEIKINDIMRVIKKGGSYRLFLSKKQFVYIPVSVFRTPGDIAKFDSILKARKPVMKGNKR